MIGLLKDIYAVKTSDISEEELNELCLLINSEKNCENEKFTNKKIRLRR